MTAKNLSYSLATYTKQSRPASTYHQAQRIVVGGADSYFGWLYFTLPFPEGASIISATLTLRSQAMEGGGRNWTVRRSEARRSYSHLAWSNQPNGVTGPGEPKTILKGGSLPNGEEWDFDVTSHMQAVADGEEWFGWRIESDESIPRNFHSRYFADDSLHPSLEIEWADAPDKPSSLSPSDGRAVDTFTPVVRFDYVDVSGNTTLAAVQVQTDASESGFASPDWDSGRVETSVPQLDLGAAGRPNLVSGEVCYWRVRVQDGTGLWSEWSDVAEFVRTPKGELVITSPPDGASVSDPTLPVLWSLNPGSRDVASWQVIVAYASNAAVWLWTTGKQTGSVSAWTIPERVIRRVDKAYVITVRVWDQFDRQSTPGDLARYEASATITLGVSESVGPVASITATDDPDAPWVVLEWQSPVAPDGFRLLRDGEFISASLTPSEVLVSGSTYRWVDRTSSPRHEHKWQARRIENGDYSWSNPGATLTPDPTGVWVFDENDPDNAVLIWNVDTSGWQYGETSAIFTVLGATTPVQITQSLRGIEDAVNGTLRDAEGVTANEWKRRMLILKGKPGVTLRLVGGDLNIPVRIREVDVAPAHEGQTDRHSVEFLFFQNGELPFEVGL